MKNILIILLILPTIILSQKKEDIRLVSVEGEFKTKEVPEDIQVNLHITEKDMKYNICFEKAVETRKKLKAVFIANGISEKAVKTNSFNVSEDYNWENNKRKKNGYSANLSMVIEEEYTPEFANQLLKSFQNYSVEVNYNFRFILSETQKEKLRDLAIKGAIKDAKQKAIVIAEAADIDLVQIHQINYSKNYIFPHSFDLMEEMECDTPPIKDSYYNNGDLKFNPQAISVVQTVNIKWSIDR
ncbi:SIMPL domain-containing protein [Labilibacter marinus]|uniref:SIMPL domain-containing protein n=1 Tax=Labilibacter marinus TaxID=1477105 RepID=UPI0009501ECB|nr:SIMPL domain-containing protein [Labilibacter marinus]